MEGSKSGVNHAFVIQFLPQSLPTTTFPHHLFVRQFRPAIQQGNPAAAMISQGLDINEPLIPQALDRLQALQTPIDINPYPTPASESITTLEFWEVILAASRAQTLCFYEHELQTLYRGMGRLKHQHDALNTRMHAIETRTARIEGALNKLFGGLWGVVTFS